MRIRGFLIVCVIFNLIKFVIKLMKNFLELGSNSLFSYIFHFLDIYYNFMIHGLEVPLILLLKL